jgi:hypothetical protein
MNIHCHAIHHITSLRVLFRTLYFHIENKLDPFSGALIQCSRNHKGWIKHPWMELIWRSVLASRNGYLSCICMSGQWQSRAKGWFSYNYLKDWRRAFVRTYHVTTYLVSNDLLDMYKDEFVFFNPLRQVDQVVVGELASYSNLVNTTRGSLGPLVVTLKF